MRSVGKRLFAETDLHAIMQHAEQYKVRDAVLDLLLVEPGASRLQLRLAASAAAVLEPILLDEPCPAEMSVASDGQSKPFMLRCAIPFTGDKKLFRCMTPVWPAAREVRGMIEGNVLVLAAEGWNADEPWLAAVIESELIEIRRVLVAQVEVLWAHARTVDGKIRTLIERVYPRIDQLALVHILQAASLGFRPQTERLAQEVVADMRRRIWREWSR